MLRVLLLRLGTLPAGSGGNFGQKRRGFMLHGLKLVHGFRGPRRLVAIVGCNQLGLSAVDAAGLIHQSPPRGSKRERRVRLRPARVLSVGRHFIALRIALAASEIIHLIAIADPDQLVIGHRDLSVCVPGFLPLRTGRSDAPATVFRLNIMKHAYTPCRRLCAV